MIYKTPSWKLKVEQHKHNKHQLSTKHYTENLRFRNTKSTKKMIYKIPSWKLKVEQHEHNKTPIIYKTLHRKLKI